MRPGLFLIYAFDNFGFFRKKVRVAVRRKAIAANVKAIVYLPVVSNI